MVILKLRHFLSLTVPLWGLLLLSCSTQKDRAINRNWHALNTKYNTLYNGNIAFEQGLEGIDASYRDDYWEPLPVERLEVSDQIELDSENNDPNFLKAEEKATKAIQKHSMDIGDLERNPQIDEAFLLLGKARYFDGRYIPALEAFNYILGKYHQSDKLNQATIWREKTNMRLDNPELAIRNLARLLKFERLSDQEYADAHAVLAQCHVMLKAPDSAIQELKIAQAYTKKKPEQGRYLFIIGQLYDQLGHKDSANYAYDRVIALRRRSPRVYMINAELRKIRNTERTEERREALWERLTELEENRENRPFLDKIYREKALFHLAYGQDSLALAYFNRSLGATQGDRRLMALDHQSLADFHFDRDRYKLAGAHYDSTLVHLEEDTRLYRSIKKRRDNLEDVIQYEDRSQYADSVIALVEMSEAQRRTYFERHIAQIKEGEAAAAQVELERIEAGLATFAKSKGGKQNQGKFYFYNITSLGYGRKEFTARWGNRSLEDDWRWSNKARTLAPGAEAEQQLAVQGEGPFGEERYSVDHYLAQVPKDPRLIDSLRADRNFSDYQLGLIYKEKFGEPVMAAEKLQRVLASNPEARLVLPSKYNLYKIYDEQGSPLALQMRQDILANHAGSRYAEILLDPQAAVPGDTDSPRARYAALYRAFEAQQYLQVIAGCETDINQYAGDPIVPKLEMLKASAIGRIQGLGAYRDALNHVALTYPNQEEGKKAQQMIEEHLPQLERLAFSPETGQAAGDHWKLVFPFKTWEEARALQLRDRLLEAIGDLRYGNKVSKDVYSPEQQFVVVHGFPSKDYALGFAELIKNNRDYRIADHNFVVLSANYKVIQVHKNLESYIAQF